MKRSFLKAMKNCLISRFKNKKINNTIAPIVDLNALNVIGPNGIGVIDLPNANVVPQSKAAIIANR
jgi:hypothetical protein